MFAYFPRHILLIRFMVTARLLIRGVHVFKDTTF